MSTRVDFHHMDIYSMDTTLTDTEEAIMTAKTVLYCRTSTAEQTVAHQRTQAEALGYTFDEVIVDEGVSGVATKLRDRPHGKRLFDILRRGDVLVVRWVDRLGRNYADVTETMRALMDRGVVVKTIINGMTFDGATTDPMQAAVRDALIGFMAASAQAQAEATKEAQKAGIAHAKADKRKYMGRKPSYTTQQIELVLQMGDKSGTEIAKETGLTRGTIHRIQHKTAEAYALAKAWGV